MGSQKNLDFSVPECVQLCRALLAGVAPREDLKDHMRRFGQGPERFQVLPGQHFGRRHEHALPACFDGHQQ